MRFIWLIIVLVVTFLINVETRTDLELNNEIYNLYSKESCYFVSVTRDYYLKFDKEKMEEYFLSKGFNVLVSVEASVMCIEEKESKIFSERVRSCFYLVKNNEVK